MKRAIRLECNVNFQAPPMFGRFLRVHPIVGVRATMSHNTFIPPPCVGAGAARYDPK